MNFLSISRWILFFLILIIIGEIIYYFSIPEGKISTISNIPTPTNTPLKKIPCPVPKEYCITARTIQVGKISFVGYSMPDETPLLSVTEGVIRIGGGGGGKYKIKGHPIVFLNADDGATTFTYEFFGTYPLPTAASIELGKEIGTNKSSFGDFKPIHDLQLIFGMEKNNKPVSLQISDIEQ